MKLKFYFILGRINWLIVLLIKGLKLGLRVRVFGFLLSWGKINSLFWVVELG